MSIVFMRSFSAVGDTRIFRVDVDGSDLIELKGGPAFSPSWSPSGSQIAFSRDDGSGLSSIHLMSAVGADLTMLEIAKGAYGSLSWSPDGSRLGFEGIGTIGSVGADGADPTYVDTPAQGKTAFPFWAPDGSGLAFVHAPNNCDAGACNHGTRDFNIFFAPQSGGDIVNITLDRVEGAIDEPDWQPFYPFLGDANCTGSVDSVDAASSLDALLILQYTAGLLDQL
jgi:Tol biopolymer transport system component